MTSVDMSDEDVVLVAGATGGVGQLVVGNLLEKGCKVRVLTRNATKAQKMFDNRVEVAIADIRDPATLPAVTHDVTYIICATGTTAFPSARWEFDPTPSLFEWVRLLTDPKYSEAKAKNSPAKIDAQGVINLVTATPRNLKRFVFISSAGVLRKNQFPFNILNAFGVLDAKYQGEQAIQSSGLPYTIIRPGRLIDGPYTSYDLNTLLAAKTNGKFDVVLGTGDTLAGDASRIDVAAAAVECIFHPSSQNLVFELVNSGPRPPIINWEQLFSNLAVT
jgi:uncharacterized protein YbjT (DUF2867 family)